MFDIPTLVKRCRAGDALAWEALVRQFQSRIFALAHYHVRDREEARDLAQEIFIHIYKGLQSFTDDATFVPWMLTVARNRCIDRIRHLNTRPHGKTTEIDEETPLPNLPDPEQALAAETQRRLIYRALDQLSQQSREMILLKEIQGLKLQEIARALDIPLGTVKSRSGRARVELAKAITELDPSYAVRPSS